MHAAQAAAGYRQIPGEGGPAGQHDGVELGPEVGGGAYGDIRRAGRAQSSLLPGLDRPVRPVFAVVPTRAVRRSPSGAHGRGAHEGDALGLHLGQAPVQHRLLHFELGDAVAEQAAGLFRPLEDRHGVAGPGQLLGCGEAGRSRAHHGHRAARPRRGRLRGHPSLAPGSLDDLVFDPLNGHRVVVDPEDAGRLARCRAQSAGELGEVVGGVEALDGVGPVVLVHQVVPLGDEVAQRAAVMAERDTAVHAARPLLLGLLCAEGLVDLTPVAQAHRDRAPARQRAPVLHEPRRLTHGRPPP